MIISRRTVLSVVAAAAAIHLTGCSKTPSKQIVLYTSVDEPVARPIIKAFTDKTGIQVILRTDGEATKTAGLAERLLAEKSNPQADVWWGNEPFHTVRLAEQDVFAEYKSPAHEKIPLVFRDSKSRWAGTALRARVLAVSDKYDKPIKSIKDLADPALKGKISMARPVAGTTQGHVAALYTYWKFDKADEFFRALLANDIALVGGNSDVAIDVGRGAKMVGLTDNDDIDAAIREGGKLRMVIPDQDGEEALGALTIPCTVALVKAGPGEVKSAQALVDYLLSPEVEKQLLEAKFARYSVFAKEGENAIKPMMVEYAAVAAQMKQATERALGILEKR